VADQLATLAGARVRLWRFDGRGLRKFGQAPDPGFTPPVPLRPGLVPTPTGSVWLMPLPGVEGVWIEVGGVAGQAVSELAPRLASILGSFLSGEREMAELSDELAARYEEIDLLYAISEILGRTVRLQEAAHTIVERVADTVSARRASIMVADEESGLLRTVAARGFSTGGLEPVPFDDPHSIAARVFREQRLIRYDPGDPLVEYPRSVTELPYRGQAFLSVPICYSTATRCVGVINLTDRLAGDRFSSDESKLVYAVANQIGAAIENARLVERDLQRQRFQREIELAHDLQLRLLPSPSVLQGDAQVAAICRPVDGVGGDFYSFTRLGQGRVGVMLGDVSSHGFSAALVMALVMSAAGIHAGAGGTPDQVLHAMLGSLGEELHRTDMFLSVFYGVIDPDGPHMVYANAGHPHAFRLCGRGGPERLAPTAPPLGLATSPGVESRVIPWDRERDLLCLWTDGLVDQAGDDGFSEQRLLTELCARRDQAPEEIVREVFKVADALTEHPADDRTLLVLRL